MSQNFLDPSCSNIELFFFYGRGRLFVNNCIFDDGALHFICLFIVLIFLCSFGFGDLCTNFDFR